MSSDKALTGLNWFEFGHMEGFCDHGNESPGSKKKVRAIFPS
jgi:hypothetical protein